MSFKVLLSCLLCLAAINLNYGEEGNDRGRERGRDNGRAGGMRGGGMMPGFMGRGNDIDKLFRASKSENIQDHENAALDVMKDDLEKQIEAVRTKIITENSDVSDAYAAAMEAFQAYLAAFDTIPELKAIKQERDEIQKIFASRDRSAMRDAYQRMGALYQKHQSLVKENAELAKLKENRLAAASTFTKTLAAALEADADYQALNKQYETLNTIQQLQREEQMAERMSRFRNRNNDDTKEKQREREAKTPGQDVGDF